MSLQNNLHEVKEKLAKDQNLLFNAFRLESFYRKYKIWIFILIAILIALGSYYGILCYLDFRKQQESENIINKLYDKNLAAEQRKEIEQQLHIINPILYDFYRYTSLQHFSILELKKEENLQILKEIMQSQNSLIAALATYQYATLTQDISMLEHFDSKPSNVLRDRAVFQAAYLYMQQNDIKRAQELLDSIQPRDNNQYIYRLATLLRHYGITQTDNVATQKDSDISHHLKPSSAEANVLLEKTTNLGNQTE